jgi:hypothetical protein
MIIRKDMTVVSGGCGPDPFNSVFALRECQERNRKGSFSKGKRDWVLFDASYLNVHDCGDRLLGNLDDCGS